MVPKSNIQMANNTIRIALTGRIDKNQDDYYFTTTKIPVMLDLRNAVIHLFPWEESETEFGITLVFREYDKNWKERSRDDDDDSPHQTRRRRTRRRADEVGEEPVPQDDDEE